MVMLLLIVPGKARGQDLSFTISLDKTAYNKGDQVKCTMMFKNTSKKDMVINNRMLVNNPNGPHEISFQILDPGVKQVRFASLVNASAESKKFLVLHPGKTETKIYLLTEDFELNEPGNYNIVGYYQNRYDAPVSLKMAPSWKGTLLSNKVNFTIR